MEGHVFGLAPVALVTVLGGVVFLILLVVFGDVRNSIVVGQVLKVLVLELGTQGIHAVRSHLPVALRLGLLLGVRVSRRIKTALAGCLLQVQVAQRLRLLGPRGRASQVLI